jgi:hypothetical protein
MNEELLELLQKEYQYAIEAQIADDEEAKEAQGLGDMAGYFDRSLHWQLPDICWALEKWEEAKYWYQHNALIVTKSRAWHVEQSGSDYPIDLLSDREASTLIKAGYLGSGRESLKRAITYWKNQPGSELVLTELGLHAAQVGISEFAIYALSIIDARQKLSVSNGKAVRLARKTLHYEPAQVNLLLGRWDKYSKEIEKLVNAEQIVQDKPGLVFPIPLQDALLAASRGLRKLESLHSGKVEPKIGQEEAKRAFEEAMLSFYQFSGQVNGDLYFMRMNTRFADELADGRELNTNPFAEK